MYFKIEKGFTLVELMAVIAIIAIIAGVAFPSYNNIIRKNSVMRDARGFQSAIESAKYIARSSGRNVKVCPTNEIEKKEPACLKDINEFNTSGTSDRLGWVVYRVVSQKGTVKDKRIVFKKLPYDNQRVRIKWTYNISKSNPLNITLSPRNSTGDSGTICFYAPYNSHDLASCSDNKAISYDVNEVRVVLSTLGKVTIKK